MDVPLDNGDEEHWSDVRNALIDAHRHQLASDGTLLKPGAIDFLSKIYQSGCPIMVCSASPGRYIESAFAACEELTREHFVGILSRENDRDYGATRSKYGLYTFAGQLLREEFGAQRVIAIDDSPDAVADAALSNMIDTVVAVPDRHTSNGDPSRFPRADYIVNDLVALRLHWDEIVANGISGIEFDSLLYRLRGETNGNVAWGNH